MQLICIRNLIFVSSLFTFQFGFCQEIAITFDDAPMGDGALFTGAERAEKILLALKQNDVDQVAFFVTTGHITPEGKSRLESYARAGHLLANHSHRHQWIHEMGARKYCDDIAKAHSILKNFPQYKPWFRYPFLNEGNTIQARDSVRQALDNLKLSNGYATIDDYDWYINQLLRKAIMDKKAIDYEGLRKIYINHVWNSIKFYDNIALKALKRSPKHVLLLHENDLAALFIGDLVAHIKAQGWKIISPEVAYQDPIAKQIPDVLFNGQGRVAAIAHSLGFPPKDLVQESEDEPNLDNLLSTVFH
jgi:peptidoglycan/xylan/chitin deacetylase (PgdA/CDA1 family)